MWKLSRGWWIVSLALTIPGIAFLIEGIHDPKARTDDGYSYVQFGTAWVLLMVVLHTVRFAYLTFQKSRAACLRERGIP